MWPLVQFSTVHIQSTEDEFRPKEDHYSYHFSSSFFRVIRNTSILQMYKHWIHSPSIYNKIQWNTFYHHHWQHHIIFNISLFYPIRNKKNQKKKSAEINGGNIFVTLTFWLVGYKSIIWSWSPYCWTYSASYNSTYQIPFTPTIHNILSVIKYYITSSVQRHIFLIFIFFLLFCFFLWDGFYSTSYIRVCLYCIIFT